MWIYTGLNDFISTMLNSSFNWKEIKNMLGLHCKANIKIYKSKNNLE